MCQASIKISSESSSNKRVLLSLQSFSCKGYPSDMSKALTCGLVIIFLTVIEHTMRSILASLQHLSPLLEDERSRINCAKQIGVNATALLICTFLGFQASHILQDMYDTVLKGKKSMSKAYDNRIFKYHPEAARIAVYFLGYQVKNTYDSIIWKDDWLLIGHHILAFCVAFGGVFPGSVHYYVPFYLGFSEASSAALSLLVLFDDQHGIMGLGESYPVLKAMFGVIFAVLFVILRVFVWSTISYYYIRDMYTVLQTNDPRLKGRRAYFQFTAVALGLLSILQVIWLGEIFRTGKEVLDKALSQ